jgi:probable rRNA maturation factor
MSEPDDPGGAPRIAVTDEQTRPVDIAALERVALRALDIARVPAGHSLSIALVDRATIVDLKDRYYGERRSTDVLSFAMDPLDAPPPAMLGDVVICVEVAERQARGLGRALGAELEQLLVHGILHLAGYDHEDAAGEMAMARAEKRILRGSRSGEAS